MRRLGRRKSEKPSEAIGLGYIIKQHFRAITPRQKRNGTNSASSVDYTLLKTLFHSEAYSKTLEKLEGAGKIGETFAHENVFQSPSHCSEELVKTKCVPTQTQIRKQLGSKLSDVFFENLSSEACLWLGLSPPLVGPDTVWINPNSRTKGKVLVTPVPEPAVVHLKALTHGSVLEVGQKYIDLLENKHRKEMEEALANQAEELEEEWRRKVASANDSTVVDGSGQCKKVVATLMEHFDSCFSELIITTQLRMRKECQLKVQEERAELASYMLTQVQDAVEKRDLELCNDFHDILSSELNILASRYINQINNERKIAIELMKQTVRKYEKKLQDLKMEMEFCSVVDVCRAITRERIECNERVRKAENVLRAKQEDLISFIQDLKTQNSILQKMSKERMMRLMQWRRKVQVLLQEFQRFINFALKTVPGQSEFMLSMEKLLLKKYPQDTFLLPEDYQNYMDCIQDKLPLGDVSPEKPMSEGSEANAQWDDEEADFLKKALVPSSSIQYHTDTECSLNFDYDTFKSMLVGRFASDIEKPQVRKRKKNTVCLWRKRSKEVSLNKSRKLYQMLTLVGENEKEHADPVDFFLQKRLNAVLKICADDPEFAKIMLGCSNK